MQCRQVGKSEGDLQAGVTCDLDFGLMCNSELLYGSEQCEDYEIRFFCDCPTMAPATSKLHYSFGTILSLPTAAKACTARRTSKSQIRIEKVVNSE